MKIKKHLFFSLSLFMFINANMKSQDVESQKDKSIEIIKRGIKLHDEKKYEEAILEFKKVQRNDSNYYLAGAEILNTYLVTKKNEEGLTLCNDLLKLKNDYTPNILIFKADFLDNLKRYDEAIKIFDKGIKDYPLNNSFIYEKGVLKLVQKDYFAAYNLFVKSIHLNPMHASSHYQLFYLAYRQNNVTAAMLAAQFFLLVENTSKRAEGMVVDLEKISKLELVCDTSITIKELENQNDFSELESIIKSKAALSEKYKSKTDLNYDLIKQMQLVIENIGKYNDVKGFYNEFYGKFFNDLNSEKFIEPYMYHILDGMNLDIVNKYNSKNKSEILKFNSWAYSYICTVFANYDENLNGIILKTPHYFNNNRITASGFQNSNKENTGYWNYYYSNGIKKSEGEFINDKRNGVWKYYSKTGEIKEETSYDKGIEKTYKTFYLNGNPRIDITITDGKIIGELKSYFSNGNVRSTKEYVDGKINGIEKQFYRNGSLKYAIKNVEDVLSGEYKEYFDNGKLSFTVNVVEGKPEGVSKSFYNNDNNSVEKEGSYLKGKYVGEWKTYFKNGKIASIGKYNNDGEKEGLWLSYFDTGVLREEENYSNNKYNGIQKYYDYDKLLWEEYVYRKGKMQEYRAYKKDGTLICDNKVNGKNFKLIQYHPNGIIRKEGTVTDGESDGNWKYYSNYGVLTHNLNFKEGKYEGKYTEYYPNNKPKVERNYVNDVETGITTTYFINGSIEKQGGALNDNRNDYWKEYFMDGTIDRIMFYTNGEVDGWNSYFNANGKIDNENLYKEGCLIKIIYYDTLGNINQTIDLPGGTGVIDKKYINDKLYFHKEFVKDYAEGFSTVYFPDGKIQSKVNNVKGKREGTLVKYYPNGKKFSETPYFNDEIDGKDIYYFDNGQLSSEDIYDNNEKHGKCLSYHENGKIFKDYNYVYDKLEGVSNMYDPTGELMCQRIYKNDLMIGYSYNDASGNLIKPIELPKNDYKLICNYKNGKKSMEANYTNGDLNGKRILYYSTGQIFTEENFYFGFEDGVSKAYFINGNVKEIEPYYYGVRHGKCQYFYENGKIKIEANYKYGEANGIYKYYDQNGHLLTELYYYNGSPYATK